MTRKEFLHTMAGAAAASALVSNGVGASALAGPSADAKPAPPKAPPKLKRGVTLYSYQFAFYKRALTLEALLAESSAIGANYIQLLPEEMVPGFPDPSDHFVGQWFDWMDKYHLVPDTYCQFQDTVLIKGQDLSLNQGVAMLERDLKLANRMGFTKLRLLIGTPIDVVEKAIPLAEKYGVWMGWELHAPANFKTPAVGRWFEVIERNKTEFLGIVPDFGIFSMRPARNFGLMGGPPLSTTTEAIVKYIGDQRYAGVEKEAIAAEISKMNPKPGDKAYLDAICRYEVVDPHEVVAHKQYVRNMHTKFWEMTEDYHEYSIPYEKIIPVLAEGGVDATMSSEFEGQRFKQIDDDEYELEQVRRQHVMLRRLLGEI
jgi:hypothetical protein